MEGEEKIKGGGEPPTPNKPRLRNIITPKTRTIRFKGRNRRFNKQLAKLLTIDEKIKNKQDKNFALLILDPNGNIADARIFKTAKTLENIVKSYAKEGYQILWHPNPVVATEKFWKLYRKTKEGHERVKLFKDFSILADENILNVREFFIDIDSNFEESYTALRELLDKLNEKSKIKIDSCITIYKTKSQRLRFSFSIIPVRPNKVSKNHKTHLENVKEAVSIINLFFKSKGLNADDSFKRINHPIWITKNQNVVKEATHRIDFYYIYKLLKSLQKELKLYETKTVPRLTNKHVDTNDEILYKAVDTMYKNAIAQGKGRYIHFLQPLAGWFKYLGKPFEEYYQVAYSYCSDKVRDIHTAWKYANPLPFTPSGTSYNLKEYMEKAKQYIIEHKEATRQDLLNDVFDGQRWLEKLVMDNLIKEGYTKCEYRKHRRGRPQKVYVYAYSVEKVGNNNAEINVEKTDNESAVLVSESVNTVFSHADTLKNRAETIIDDFRLLITPSIRGCVLDMVVGVTPLSPLNFTKGTKNEVLVDLLVSGFSEREWKEELAKLVEKKKQLFDFEATLREERLKALFGAYVSISTRGPDQKQTRGPNIPGTQPGTQSNNTDARGPNNIFLPKLKKIPRHWDYGNLPF